MHPLHATFLLTNTIVFCGNKIALLLSGLILLILSTYSEAMSLFPTPQEVVLSSPLEGTLLYQAKPISGIKVERKLRWFDGDESYEDFVFTDHNGYFSLPVVQKTLKLSSLVQFVVVQEIYAILNEDRIVIWALGKGAKIEYSELGGKPINLRCELTSEERITRDYNNPMMTRCTWDALEPWVDTEYPD